MKIITRQPLKWKWTSPFEQLLQTKQTQIRVYFFAYGNMIYLILYTSGPKINFFVLCTNLKVYLNNYSLWVELNMNIHEGKGYDIQWNVYISGEEVVHLDI